MKLSSGEPNKAGGRC